MRYLVYVFFACCFFKKVQGGGVGGTGGIAVSLTQYDFKNGAYIIDIPGVYTFQEDIVFRPTGTLNSSEPETWMFPDITTAPYNKSPFILGHFAGIIIQTDGVTLDLNGKTFSQSEEHALMQRFFALVELASSPFKPNVGPAAFGDASSFFPASNVVIENGKFGRSSHHAIHGNNNKGVTLRYLDISDFEVAGIALNAADEVVVDTVTVHSTRADVPVNGRLSAAVFLLQALRRHLGTLDHGKANAPLSAAASVLVTAQGNLRASLYKFLKTGEDTEGPTGGLFATMTGGVPDASLVAGIMLHGDFTVGGFARTQPSDFSSNVDLRNVVVRSLKISPGEIGALVSTAASPPSGSTVNPYSSSTHAHDPVGAVFDLDFAANQTNGGTYVPNPLAEMQLAFADYALKCQALTASGCVTMTDAFQAGLLARNTIGQGVVKWAWGNTTTPGGGGTMTLDDLKEEHGYKVVGNKDVMFHAIKGLVGLKLDGVSDVQVENVKVEYLENLANHGRRSWSALAESHQTPTSNYYEYTGYANRGLSVASSVRVSVDKIIVREASTAVEGVEAVFVDSMFALRDVAVTNLQNQFEFHSKEDEEAEAAAATVVTPDEEETDEDGDDEEKNRYSMFEISVIVLTSLCSALFSGLLVVLIFTCAILPSMRGGGIKITPVGAGGGREEEGGADDTPRSPKVSDKLLTGRSVTLRGSCSYVDYPITSGDGKNDDCDNDGSVGEKRRSQAWVGI